MSSSFAAEWPELATEEQQQEGDTESEAADLLQNTGRVLKFGVHLLWQVIRVRVRLVDVENDAIDDAVRDHDQEVGDAESDQSLGEVEVIGFLSLSRLPVEQAGQHQRHHEHRHHHH